MRKTALHEIGGEVPTNSAEEIIAFSLPYIVAVELEGVADMLFHRWSCESVKEKGGAAKGSAGKKTDDVKSYVYRNDKDEMCIPGEYVRQAMIGAAKYRQDPRSPRKSAMDLYKAAVISLTPLASLGLKTWDYLDTRRAVVQRNGINRTRPAFKTGWRTQFEFQVNLPEYVSIHDFAETLGNAGRLIGIGDFRPTYGRFRVASCEIVNS
jgi:hypothetical protein